MGVLLHAWLGALAGAAPAMATPPPAPTPCGEIVREIDDLMRKTIVQGSPGMIAAAAFDGRPVVVRTLGWANLEHRVPLRRNSVFALASVTKQFTAAVILKLMEEGRLRLDDKVATYVPELAEGRRITIYQLLVQTSGLPDYAEDPTGSPTKAVPKTPLEMVEWIGRLSKAMQFEPGSKWAYSNSNYVLLGLIAERVGKRPLAQMFEEMLFRPAGLTATAFDNPRDVVFFRAQGYRKSKTAPSGFTNAEWISPTIPGAAGGLRTTADDLIRWSHALYNGRILRPATVKLMTSPGRLNDGRTTKLGMPEAWQKRHERRLRDGRVHQPDAVRAEGLAPGRHRRLLDLAGLLPSAAHDARVAGEFAVRRHGQCRHRRTGVQAARPEMRRATGADRALICARAVAPGVIS